MAAQAHIVTNFGPDWHISDNFSSDKEQGTPTCDSWLCDTYVIYG